MKKCPVLCFNLTQRGLLIVLSNFAILTQRTRGTIKKISLVQNNTQKFITVEKQRYKTFLKANLPHALMLHPPQQVQSSVLYNINSLIPWSD